MATFTPRNWANGYLVQNTDLIDLEQRIAAYAAKAGVDVFDAASQGAMLALSTAEKGDFCFRSDTGTTYVLTAEPPSTLANWKVQPVPSSVANATGLVAGQTPRANGSGGFVYRTPLEIDARDYGVTANGSTDDRAALQAALDAAEAATLTVDSASGTGVPAVVVLPLGYTKVLGGITIASNVHLDGQGDRTILMLQGGSNTNLIQSKSWGSATGFDRGIKIGMGRGLRLLGNKANQTVGPVRTYVTADTAVSTTPTTVPVHDTTGFPTSGRVWIGYAQFTYTGKTSTTLTGVTRASGSDTLRAGSWITNANAQGHLIAIQGSRCHVRVYGTDGAANGIVFQGPDPVASGGVIVPENVIHDGCRISLCNGHQVEIGQNCPDGLMGKLVAGPSGSMSTMIIRSADWMFDQLHLVGSYGSTIYNTPAAITIAASDFRGSKIYLDTYPGTSFIVDASIQGWFNVNDCDISQVRLFQCSWGVGGGGHGVLFRGITSHGNIQRHRFDGVNMSNSPIGVGYVNGAFVRTVGVQDFVSPPGGKIQINNAMDLLPSSSIGSCPVVFGADTIHYTGKSSAFTKLTADAVVGATSITVADTSAFDASGTITLLAEQNNTFTPMVVTYTSKTATTFDGIPPNGTGSITAATSSAGERGAVGQHYLLGCTGGVTASKPNDQTGRVTAMMPLVSALQVTNPTFRSYRVSRFNMQSSDTYSRNGGWAGDKPLRATGTATIAVGQTSVTVAHGLPVETPGYRDATPRTDPQSRYWVSADDTNLTITVASAISGSPVVFDWNIENVA